MQDEKIPQFPPNQQQAQSPPPPDNSQPSQTQDQNLTVQNQPNQPYIPQQSNMPQSAQVQQPQTPQDEHRAVAFAAQKPKKERGILSFAATLLVAFVLVQVINMFLFQSYKVFGNSMSPTLHDGDRLIISKIGKTGAKVRGKLFEPKRGAVIVFVDPKQPDLQLIKRVIGLPGERVVVKNGKIKVYNTQHPAGFDPDTSGIYTADLPETSGNADITVPEGHLFVSGDNRLGSNSLDSRNELGTVPEELVVGTLEVRLWPLSDARFF